jgi:hydroxypyruvate isomerase
MIFREVDFLERIPKVKAAGFDAFEFWGTGSKDLAEVKRLKQQHGLAVTSFTIEYQQPLSEPANRASFVEGTKRAVQIAKDLSCKAVIATTGSETAAPRRQQHDTIVAGLKAAAPIAEAAGVTIVLEPLNILVDHKGYYLATSAEGFEMIREVGSPNVKLLYDIYHQQITEGNLIATITANIAEIGHVH